MNNRDIKTLITIEEPMAKGYDKTFAMNEMMKLYRLYKMFEKLEYINPNEISDVVGTNPKTLKKDFEDFTGFKWGENRDLMIQVTRKNKTQLYKRNQLKNNEAK